MKKLLAMALVMAGMIAFVCVGCGKSEPAPTPPATPKTGAVDTKKPAGEVDTNAVKEDVKKTGEDVKKAVKDTKEKETE